jgi:glucose/arabinose dehydrogenase
VKNRESKFIFVALIALAAALAALGAAPAGAQSDGEQPAPAAAEGKAFLSALVPIATGLDLPVSLAQAADGTGRLFIVEQGGLILIHDGNSLLTTPFLDLSGLVSCCGERGLLGLAFHPNYESNGFFYVHYTDVAGDTMIARYSVSADPNVADPNSDLELLPVDQPFSNHNGGQLQFGPDGYLYIGLGDGGSAGDPGNRAQDLGELLGKLLRIDVNNNDIGDGLPYDIPPDNPFVSEPNARDEIWAYGLRNPWRFSFDRVSGDLFLGDVGQSEWEEIDHQPAGSPGGENYGWRLMEGPDCYNPPIDCDDGTLVHPILAYPHAGSVCAVIGGYVYRGTALPQYVGAYFFSDNCTGQMWVAKERANGTWRVRELVDSAFFPSTFGETESGELCFADYSGGTVYCILP